MSIPAQGAVGAETKIDHEFKSHPDVFWPAARGEKTFEYRRDDRGGYEVGQTVRLRCYGPLTGYMDVPPLDRRITNILRGGEFELPMGYCILSLAPLATPRTDSAEPHFGYLFHNPDTGEEWSESHPIESGEVEDAENVRPATAKALHELLIEAWSELEDARADLYAPAPATPPGVPDSLRADLMHACYGVHDEPDLNRKSVRISCLNEDGALAVRNWLLDLRDGISTHLPGRNAETDALVDRFAVALKVKLRAAEAKYDWQNGWIKDDWRVECQRGLLLHIGKGDPLDVAAYAAFCWHHGWSTSSQRSTEFVTGAVEPTAAAIAAFAARYPAGALSETSDHAIECWNRVAVAACLAGQSTGQGADLRKTLTLIREFAGSSILVRNDALDHIYVVASKALDPNSPIPEPVGKPDSASDSLRSLSEGDRDLLNSVLDWLRGVCPCGNAGPAQCPVCGARIDDETGFCAIDHRCKIPAHLLGRIETALGIASHPAGQSAGSGETIAVQKRDLVKMVDAAFAVDPSVPAEAQGDNLFAAATKLASYLPLGLECTGCGSRESIEAIQARGFSSCCPERKMQPAPDSTRTGQGEAGLSWRDMKDAPKGTPIIAKHKPNSLMPHGWVAVILLGHRDEEEAGSLDTILHYNGNALYSGFHGCWDGWLPVDALAARPAAPEAQGAWSFDMEVAPRDGSAVEIANDRGQFIAQFDATWDDGGWWMVSDGKDPERPLRGDKPFAWRIPTKAPAPPSSGQEG
jgi:hypothetical protein